MLLKPCGLGMGYNIDTPYWEKDLKKIQINLTK